MCLKTINSSVVLGINIIFLVICSFAGIALMIIGAKMCYTDLTDKLPADYDFMQSRRYVKIVLAGVVVAINPFLGGCGVRKSSPYLLTIYGIIALVIFIGLLALGFFDIVSINELKLENTIQEIFLNARNNNKTGPSYVIQSNFHCCGTDGPSFWSTIPESCYSEEKVLASNLYKDGCFKRVSDTIKDEGEFPRSGIVTWCVFVGAIKMFSGVLALSHANSIRNKARRERANHIII